MWRHLDGRTDMTDGRPDELGIAELAQRAGVTPRTIRYYVAEGLLPPPGGRGQRRSYGQEHVRRLDTIRRLKAAYLPLQEIRRRLNCDGDAIDGVVAPDTSVATGRTDLSRPGSVPGDSAIATARSAQWKSASVTSVGTLPGSSGPLQMGHAEVYESTDAVWRRVTLVPGVELHVRETADPDLSAAIDRLIEEATRMLAPPARRGRAARPAAT